MKDLKINVPTLVIGGLIAYALAKYSGSIGGIQPVLIDLNSSNSIIEDAEGFIKSGITRNGLTSSSIIEDAEGFIKRQTSRTGQNLPVYKRINAPYTSAYLVTGKDVLKLNKNRYF